MRTQRLIVAGNSDTFARVARSLGHWTPRYERCEVATHGPGTAKDHARRWCERARVPFHGATTPTDEDVVLWFGGDGLSLVRATGARVVEVV